MDDDLPTHFKVSERDEDGDNAPGFSGGVVAFGAPSERGGYHSMGVSGFGRVRDLVMLAWDSGPNYRYMNRQDCLDLAVWLTRQAYRMESDDD